MIITSETAIFLLYVTKACFVLYPQKSFGLFFRLPANLQNLHTSFLIVREMNSFFSVVARMQYIRSPVCRYGFHACCFFLSFAMASLVNQKVLLCHYWELILVCISSFGHLTMRRKTSMNLLLLVHLDQFPNPFPINSDSSFLNQLYGIFDDSAFFEKIVITFVL